MRFIKDLLFFELNTTGPDTDKDNILQLSAVLIDKNNFLEKDYFNSYVRVSYLDSVILEHSKLLGITSDVLRKSPKIYDVIKQFKSRFGNQAILGTHSLNNLMFLRAGFKKAALPFEFDSHIVDIWTLGYIYCLNYGLKKLPTLQTFFDFFKLKPKNHMDALERVRLEVEVFKKIITEA